MALADRVKALVIFVVGCFVSVYVLFLIAISIIKNPVLVFIKKKYDEPPDVLNDPDLGTHCYIHLEEVKIHYVASGKENRPLMLFVHGFPHFWYTWKHQIKEFQKDYRVVAIDMRGYGESDKPLGVCSYRRDKVAKDIKQLIPALGYCSCILVGHDWGGSVLVHFASLYPDMVDKLVVMGVCHPNAFPDYLRRHISQVKRSWYILAFQPPFVSELYLTIGDMVHFVSSLTQAPFGLRVAKLSHADIEAYKYTFSKSGFTGPINYYRASLQLRPVALSNIKKPVLLVWGKQDPVFDVELVEASARYFDKFTVKFLEESGHIMHMDQPEEVNCIIREFLK